MRVSLDEVREVLDDLIAERKNREEIASWALERQLAEDSEDLEYCPSTEEDKIWKAITYPGRFHKK